MATKMVAWAPPGSTPALTAVLAPQGTELFGLMTYLEEYLSDRVHQMIRKAGVDQAREAIMTYLPQNHDFLSLHPNHWAIELLQAGELVQTRLAENIPGHFPFRVKGENVRARRALETVDLETWLNLAVPRENHGA